MTGIDNHKDSFDHKQSFLVKNTEATMLQQLVLVENWSSVTTKIPSSSNQLNLSYRIFILHIRLKHFEASWAVWNHNPYHIHIISILLNASHIDSNSRWCARINFEPIDSDNIFRYRGLCGVSRWRSLCPRWGRRRRCLLLGTWTLSRELGLLSCTNTRRLWDESIT